MADGQSFCKPTRFLRRFPAWKARPDLRVQVTSPMTIMTSSAIRRPGVTGSSFTLVATLDPTVAVPRWIPRIREIPSLETLGTVSTKFRTDGRMDFGWKQKPMKKCERKYLLQQTEKTYEKKKSMIFKAPNPQPSAAHSFERSTLVRFHRNWKI